MPEHAGINRAGFDGTGSDRTGFDGTGSDGTGFDRTGFDRVGEIIAAAVRERAVPGVVALAGRGGSTLGSWVAGDADTTVSAGRPMRADTVFDLASLTKVVATTTMTLSLAGAGRLGLDDPVRRYLPVSWDVSIRQLLSHTSGLPASVLFFEWCATREALLRGLFSCSLEAPPGTRVAYSDLGFMALGEVVAQVAGAPLDAAFRDLVTEPLNMADTCFLPSGPPERFAATEIRADGTAWTGIVHDENARVLDGVAGHAGVFATAADLGRFAAWWVSPGDGPVPVALRREAEALATPGLNGYRGLGWVRAGDRSDILGDAWPPSAVSHTGFTGTSLALDSASGAWLVLLTNRVQFTRDPAPVRALRRAVHAAAATLLFPGVLPKRPISHSPTVSMIRWAFSGVDRPNRPTRRCGTGRPPQAHGQDGGSAVLVVPDSQLCHWGTSPCPRPSPAPGRPCLGNAVAPGPRLALARGHEHPGCSPTRDWMVTREMRS